MHCRPSMRVSMRSLAAIGLIFAAMPLAAGTGAADRLPTNGRPMRDARDDLRFVIVGDRTAGHRPGVFEQAMKQVDLLKPQFVVSVGDFIEGYIDDEAEINRRWQEVEAATAQLPMPFYYVVGNNDIGNATMGRVWDQRRGKRYYSFVQHDILFIALDTEDPPPGEAEKKKLRQEYSLKERMAARELASMSPEDVRKTLAANPRLAEMVRLSQSTEKVGFSAAQIDWVRKTLAAHPKVRWTFFLMHRPAWTYDSPEFRGIEDMAKGRPHSFVAGHYHSYAHSVRDGIDYFQMGTTGGTGPDKQGDQVLMVTVEERAAPTVALIGLDGLRDRDARMPATDPGVTAPPAQSVAGSDHLLPLEGGRNFRDLGGYATAMAAPSGRGASCAPARCSA